jgi:Fe-S-cluster containining protein
MFPCTSCGLCCQNISNIKELKNYDLGNGICVYFDHTNYGCKIYDNRPNICSVDKMFQLEYKKYFTKERFYMENAKVCNTLQEEYGLDRSFKVIIGEMNNGIR